MRHYLTALTAGLFFMLVRVSPVRADNTDLYVITNAGRVFHVDKANPSISTTRYVRSVAIPDGSGTFGALIWKDGHFYTTFGVPTQVIRFGFEPDDEVVVGTLATISPYLALRSDGTVWTTVHDFPYGNTRLRTIDLDTLQLGGSITTPSPQFNTLDPSSGFWYILGMTFDSSNRLLVNLVANNGIRIARFNSSMDGTWVKNCGSLASPLPCMDGALFGLATDPATGTIYAALHTGITTLSFPENPPAEHTLISNGGVYVLDENDLAEDELLITGLTFAPAPPAKPCAYYQFGAAVACL